jgi:hypothetical protein
VANPFSSFHWCLKLPGLFPSSSFPFPFLSHPRKGALAMPSFRHTTTPPSPSMLCVGPRSSMMLCSLLCSFSLSRPSLLPRCLHLCRGERERKRRDEALTQWAINCKACQLYWRPCSFFNPSMS